MKESRLTKFQGLIAREYGIDIDATQLRDLVEEVLNEGPVTRSIGGKELTLFEYSRGSVCAAINVIEMEEGDDED